MPPLPPLAKLVGVAGACGIGIGVMALLVLKERDKLANQASFVTGAVQLLKEQPITKELLGEELKVGKASLADGWSRADKFKVQIRVPIIGDKDKAYLFAYARRNSEEEKLQLYKLEATFSTVNDKKLVLMDRTNEDYSDLVEIIQPAVERAKATEEEKRRKEEEERLNAAKALQAMSPWEKKKRFVEEMKNWQPQR